MLISYQAFIEVLKYRPVIFLHLPPSLSAVYTKTPIYPHPGIYFGHFVSLVMHIPQLHLFVLELSPHLDFFFF